MISKKIAAFATAGAILAASVVPASAYPNPTVIRPNWGVVGVLASTASVIVDAMYIAATQCREMTAQEAGIALLPVAGPLVNATQPQMNKCKK
jgi:hypothetical protein